MRSKSRFAEAEGGVIKPGIVSAFSATESIWCHSMRLEWLICERNLHIALIIS
jgi:hypothetical protein